MASGSSKGITSLRPRRKSLSSKLGEPKEIIICSDESVLEEPPPPTPNIVVPEINLDLVDGYLKLKPIVLDDYVFLDNEVEFHNGSGKCSFNKNGIKKGIIRNHFFHIQQHYPEDDFDFEKYPEFPHTKKDEALDEYESVVRQSVERLLINDENPPKNEELNRKFPYGGHKTDAKENVLGTEVIDLEEELLGARNQIPSTSAQSAGQSCSFSNSSGSTKPLKKRERKCLSAQSAAPTRRSVRLSGKFTSLRLHETKH